MEKKKPIMLKDGKTKLSDIIPFEIHGLGSYDMEFLLNPIVGVKLPGVEGRIIFSLTDDGVGDLVIVEFPEVVKLYRDLDDNLCIDVKTTEGKKKGGIETIEIFDFRIINH